MSRPRLVRLCAVIAATGALSFVGIASAGAVNSGDQVPGAAAAVTPFTTGAPFSSGQNINVVVPANSIFTSNTAVNVLECSAPNDVLPTDPSACDGNTINGSTVFPNSDGSINFKTATGGDYSVYALPDSISLGETPDGPACSLTVPCVLFIGENQNDFTQPHVFSQFFFVKANADDHGENPGDGSAPFAITTTSLPKGAVDSAYSATLTATSGKTPYTWSVTGGTLPAGLKLATTGAITGTPTTAGTSSVTFTAKDANSPAQSVSATLPITINPKVAITTTALPGATYEAPYTATVAASGGTLPYTWSHTGTLPAGLTLNASTGVISGTPTKAASVTITFKVTDSSKPVVSVSKGIKLVIAKANQTISFTSTAPVNPAIGTTYTPTATATSGLAVKFTIDTKSTLQACTVNATTHVVSFKKAGTCIVDANQAGNTDINKAVEVQQTIHIP